MTTLLARVPTGQDPRTPPAAPESGWRDSGGDACPDGICAHCGQPAPQGERFCCTGCAGAYALIHELGLQRYYQGRDPGQVPAPVLPTGEDGTGGDAVGDLRQFATRQPDGTWGLTLLVDGVHCAACIWLIETALKRDPAVTQARVNLTARRLTLRWTGEPADGTRLAQLVTRLGYRVVPYDNARAQRSVDEEGRRLLRALAVAGFAAGNIMLLSVAVWAGLGQGGDGMGSATRDLFHWLSALIALPAILYAGQPFFRPAWAALRHGRTTMDVPISIGVTLASAMSLWETIVSGEHAFFDSATMLLFFLLIGRYLDHQARGKARSAAELLIGFMRQSVSRLEADGSISRVPADRVTAGDRVLVAAGENIAVDGRILEGRSAIDRSLIDGESLPADVGPGDDVLAGMVNLTGPLTVTVGATGDGTFLAGIARLMDAAEQGRARLVMLADRVARFYAPSVHSLALLTFIGWWLAGPWEPALLNAVAVLIITCPCALGLAVPVVQVVASGRLMRSGVLLKSATALERLETVDTVVFDKTGTLTLGQLELVPSPALDPATLTLAATLAAAHVSMAPATAADISQTAADLVFQGKSLEAVTTALDMAKSSGIVVRQNIVMAILYNVFAVPLAMAGLVTPLIAALAMSSSSLLVVGNALRLSRRKADASRRDARG